jgi:hypothetical protein
MASRLVRANNNVVLIAAGVAFLLLAVRGAQSAEAFAHRYRMPLAMMSGGVIIDVIFGLALLFVAIRRSKFAGATAVVIATFLIFRFALGAVASLLFARAFVSWWNGIDLALAFAILWPSLFPWSRSANKPALLWMALIFGLLTLLCGSLALLARL